MNKLTKQQIKEMKELRKKGMNTYELAKKYNVAQSTICYHTDKTSKKRISYSNRKEYQKAYFKKRYKEDKEFREKQQARARKNKVEQQLKGGKKQS